MVEHRILTDEEHDRRYDCTGAATRWCPIHGDCTCDPDDAGQCGWWAGVGGAASGSNGAG